MDAKVAIAIDAMDYEQIDPKITKAISATKQIPQIIKKQTPDNTYVIYFWDWLVWLTDTSINGKLYEDPDEYFAEVLHGTRHAMICIFENDDIYKSINASDENGTDEEFEEILKLNTEICLFDTDSPLTPINEAPFMSRQRLADLFKAYVSKDAEATELSYVYDALTFAGCDHDEIRALGFGYVIPEDTQEE